MEQRDHRSRVLKNQKGAKTFLPETGKNFLF